MSPSVVVFADAEVGLGCVKWLIENYYSDLARVVTIDKNNIFRLAEENGLSTHIFNSESSYLHSFNEPKLRCDLGLLLWWPRIIGTSIINSTKLGFVNTHPSMLPFNRGKHYNFWALVEQCPFGVSLHMVEQGVDCGSLVAQKRIHYTWEDTGKSLYFKAISGMKELFIDSYPSLRMLNFATNPQELSRGSFHLSSELETASRINLDKPTTARHILNLLRARTFEDHPACSFSDDGVEYEARIEITRKDVIF